eukprot:364600-Chlamydomonas_euryale.AAC.9
MKRCLADSAIWLARWVSCLAAAQLPACFTRMWNPVSFKDDRRIDFGDSRPFKNMDMAKAGLHKPKACSTIPPFGCVKHVAACGLHE